MKKKGIISNALEQYEKNHVCPNCGGTSISFSLALEPTKRSTGSGCFLSYIVFVLLLFIPIIGWILLYAMATEKRKPTSVTYGLCGTCGYSWKVFENKPKNKPSAFFIISLILIFLLVIGFVSFIIYFKSKL